MREFRKFASELFDRYEGNFTVFIITLIAFFIVNHYDILGFKKGFDADIANIFYFLIAFAIYFVVALIRDIFFIWRRVKIIPNPKGDQDFIRKQSFEGFIFYIGLDVVIPKDWDITDCYVTLDKAIPVYFEKGVTRGKAFSEWLADKMKPEYKALRWKSPLANNNYKINIGENSHIETIRIGEIMYGYMTDVRKKKVDYHSFNFCLFRRNEDAIIHNQMGLYEISISLHWKYNNRKMMSKNFNGYVYSGFKDGVYKLIVKEGDYSKDKEVPKPLLQEIDEIHEKPKKSPRKTTKGTKKRSPH